MRITSDDKLMIALAVAVTVLVLGALFMAISWQEQQNKAWADFTAQHVCERTQHVKPGYYITTFIHVGNALHPVMTWVPGQVMWKCDDGNEYWREQ